MILYLWQKNMERLNNKQKIEKSEANDFTLQIITLKKQFQKIMLLATSRSALNKR